jgi:tetratricopeptide (TPR) repeat protein
MWAHGAPGQRAPEVLLVTMPIVRFAAVLALSIALSASATPTAAPAPRPAEGSTTLPAAATTVVERRSSRPALLLVLPFTNKGTSEPDWLSWGFAEYVGEGLALAGYQVVDDEERQGALVDVGLDDQPRLTLASACELARRLGARHVVTGEWTSASSHISFTARVIDADRLRLIRESSASTHVGQLIPELARMVADLAGDAGRGPAAKRDLEVLASAKPEALMAWLEAAGEREDAVQHLSAALEADPTFMPARLDLAERHLDESEPEIAAKLLDPIPVDAALYHRARAHLLAGRAAIAMDDASGALVSIGEALKDLPRPEWLAWKAQAQLLAGQRDAARETAQRVLADCPNNDLALDLIDQLDGGGAADAVSMGGVE